MCSAHIFGTHKILNREVPKPQTIEKLCNVSSSLKVEFHEFVTIRSLFPANHNVHIFLILYIFRAKDIYMN